MPERTPAEEKNFTHNVKTKKHLPWTLFLSRNAGRLIWLQLLRPPLQLPDNRMCGLGFLEIHCPCKSFNRDPPEEGHKHTGENNEKRFISTKLSLRVSCEHGTSRNGIVDKQIAMRRYVSFSEEYCYISIPLVNLQSEWHKYLECFFWMKVVFPRLLFKIS